MCSLSNGAALMKCTSPITAYQHLAGGKPVFKEPQASKLLYKKLQLPCNGCIACRMTKSLDWEIRLNHETQMTELPALFVTLTYDQEHCPKDFGLHYRDFQLFMKRLRKQFKGVKIRFFVVGEYGSKGSRPHFHAILFGLELNDLTEIRTVTKSEATVVNGIQVKPAHKYSFYESEAINKAWQNGKHDVAFATPETMRYVSGYLLKEQGLAKSHDITDPETGEIYKRRKPFIRCSTRPGLGAKWFEKFRGDVFPSDHVVYKGKTHKAPAYYLKLLERTDPEMAAQVRIKRSEYLNTPEAREAQKPEVLKAREISLKRNRASRKVGEKL